MVGSNFMPLLEEDIPLEHIPERVGGLYKPYNEPYAFDLSVGGALHYPGARPLPGVIANAVAARNAAGRSSAAAMLFADADGGHTGGLEELQLEKEQEQEQGSARAVSAASAVGNLHPHSASTSSVGFMLLHQIVVAELGICRRHPVRTTVAAGFFVLMVVLRYLGLLQYFGFPVLVVVFVFDLKFLVSALLGRFGVKVE
jgi:hypothetical protein